MLNWINSTFSPERWSPELQQVLDHVIDTMLELYDAGGGVEGGT